MVLSGRKLSCEQLFFSIFFDNFDNAFFQRGKWCVMMAHSLSAKIRFCVAEK